MAQTLLPIDKSLLQVHPASPRHVTSSQAWFLATQKPSSEACMDTSVSGSHHLLPALIQSCLSLPLHVFVQPNQMSIMMQVFDQSRTPTPPKSCWNEAIACRPPSCPSQPVSSASETERRHLSWLASRTVRSRQAPLCRAEGAPDHL